MAEQSLLDIVIHLSSWIESLHEKNLKNEAQNLKYEAQVETLSRDLAKAQNLIELLEARLSAYQGGTHHMQNQSTSIGTDSKISITQQLQPPISTSTSVRHHQIDESEHQQITNQADQHHLLSPQNQATSHQPSSDPMQQQQQQPLGQHSTAQQSQQQHIMQHPQMSLGAQPSTQPIMQSVSNQPQPQHPHMIYQSIPIASGPSFVPQPQYVWTTYDSGLAANGISGYHYDHYSNTIAPGGSTVVAPATAFVQQQP